MQNRQLAPASPTCAKCLGKPSMRDVLGFSWCEEHEPSCRLMNWLEAHSWPFLDCVPYAFTPDKTCAMWQVLLGSEDCILHGLIYIDYIEAEGIVAPTRQRESVVR